MATTTTVRHGARSQAAEYAVLIAALAAVMASAILLLGIFGP